MIRHSTLRRLLVLAGCTVLLAGCETTGPGAVPMAAAPPQPPMTRTRAAAECWMLTEKTEQGMNLDRRADVVDACIEKRMKQAGAKAS